MSDKVFDSPGRGRKPCPKCKKYVGVRSSSCPACNHAFPKPSGDKQPERPAEQGPMAVREAQEIPRVAVGNLRYVLTPADPGKNMPFCPAEPAGEWPHTDEDIRSWVEAALLGGVGRGCLYTTEALMYFAGSCFWPYPKDAVQWKRAKEVVKAYGPVAIEGMRNGRRAAFQDDAPEGV